MTTLYCDESGFSGPNLYHDNAIYFTYAGVAIEPDEAEAALGEFRRRQGHSQGEVKFANARKRDRGVAALDWLLAEHGHRAKVWCAYKKYATAGKFFEYVFEPILTDHNSLFYRHDFHRFVANLLLAGSNLKDSGANELLADAQRMVRDRDATGLKRLLVAPALRTEKAFDDIADVALGYRDRVLAEVDSLSAMEDGGVWMMDLTVTAFGMVVRSHAAENPVLTVVCDDSKPLKAGLDVASRIAEADFGAMMGAMGWSAGERARLQEPVRLAKASEQMAGVQIADLFAGMVREVLTNGVSEPGGRWRERVWGEVLMPTSVLPDFDYIDLNRPMPRVNAQVLKELALRARYGADPVVGMARFYEVFKRREGIHPMC